MKVRQDERDNTHVEWELESVTPVMIDWFWSNMEKGFYLWHPKEHEEFYWESKPKGKDFIGKVHVAPQTWSDGQRIEPHIRFEDIAKLDKSITDYIVYSHAIVVGAVCLKKEEFKPGLPVIAYRIHQWESSDTGVKGISSCIGETREKGMVWSKHAGEEVGYWADFLPELYKLYKVIDNPVVCPFYSLKVERKEDKIYYLENK
jgi:hypothetical protein